MVSSEGCSLALPPVEESRSEDRVSSIAVLVETHSATLFRVANSVLRSRTEAEDVVQDTFLRVLQYRGELDGIRDLRVWLIRITWNLALDRRRRIRPDQMDDVFVGSLIASTTPADQALEETQHMTQVLRELDALPRLERQVLLLSAIEELGTTEVGAVLGKSESAVRALLFRARNRLRDRIEKGSRR